ncbi:pirin-like protein At1g50590 [Paraglaciecola agarilytica NO2]|uniref:Pirin-like protein At1g50590 n=2 Tax=Paraglaciecola chathamensis TaxID=368405 RepID=A0ABQ0IAL6_9ALTE|nr:pirin-like protein At1g50590 [Paraglaciecola agarilytica NO2]
MEFSPILQRRGVGEHPNRGFETVTLVYQGEVAHKDSTGKHGLIGPGDVQWMTAGQGILHEEFHSEALSRDGGTLELMQLWVNLPKRDKLTKPNYQTITADKIPVIAIPENRGFLTIIAGDVSGLKGSAKTHSPIIVMDGSIKKGGKCDYPFNHGWSLIVVIRKGHVKVNHQPVTTGQTITFSQ